jgi:hypothetical protein
MPGDGCNPGAPVRSYGTAAGLTGEHLGKTSCAIGGVATSVPRILHGGGASIEYQPLRERAERPTSELLLVRQDSAITTV